MGRIFSMTIRLTLSEIEAIQKAFKHFFPKEDRLWIFGSRVDPTKKGGDIDLFIETHLSDPQIINEVQLNFLIQLYHQIGLQKIDIVIYRLSCPTTSPIYDIARQEGIQLI